jgi:glucokinase
VRSRWCREINGSAAVVVINEGIGSTLIIGGHLYGGATLGAGQAGHISIDPAGRGNRGCWEALACDPATLARYNSKRGTKAESIPNLIARARSKDELASAALNETALHLGAGIIILVHLLNPELLVIKGEITGAWAEIEPEIRAVLKQRALHANREPLMLRPSPIKRNTTLSGQSVLPFADVLQLPESAKV